MAAALVCLAIASSGCTRGPVGVRWAGDPDTIPSAFARPSAALAWPGSTRAYQVRADGDFYNGVWTIALYPSASGIAAGPPRRIAYEERWRPVAHWRRTSGDVRWEFEACALPAPAPADTSELVALAVRAVNTGRAAAACSLRVEVTPAPRDAGWTASDAATAGAAPRRWNAPGGAVAGYSHDLETSGSAGVSNVTLAPGGEHAWQLVLAAHALPRAVLERWSRAGQASREAEARRYWEAAVARGTRIELADPEVEDALRAARVLLLTSTLHAAGATLPTAGPFQYHDVWLRDGARSVAALSVSGYTAEARALASGLACFQWASGAFLSQRGQLDGNGQAMWAFAQAELRPAPDSTVTRFAERALEACRWIEAQRHFGASAPWPNATMLPYGDPRDAELVRAQLVGNDAWSLAGLESASRLLRAAGQPDAATQVDALLASYAADFRAALVGTRRRDIPPSWQGVGTDWGNLAVAWPTRALPASDSRCAALAARAWASCPESGLVAYLHPDSLHGYLGADLGTWALLAGRPADAQRVLGGLLRWRDATGAGAEMFSRGGRDFGADLPPHPMCAAAVLSLVRNMLLYDDGDTLQLTLGPRAAWWRGARVSGAPTRWGTLDLSFRREQDRVQWTWTPVSAWTALSLPAGTELAEAAGAPLSGNAGARVVLAPPGTREARVRVRGAQP